jgi:uncharacterized membrane protein YeaQ/YmgE (transglycosylase-associated protein family)
LQALRDIFVALGVVYALDLATRGVSKIVYGSRDDLLGQGLDAAHWIASACSFLLAFVAGLLVMQLICWKWRASATAAIAVAVTIGVPAWWYNQMNSQGLSVEFTDAIRLAAGILDVTLGLVVGVAAGKAWIARRGARFSIRTQGGLMSRFTLKSQSGITVLSLVLLTALSLVTYFALPGSPSSETFWLSFLIICLGACVGALLAALVSPFHTSEGQAFKLVAGIASAFLAGFVWDSFEKDIRNVLDSLNSPASPGPARLFAFSVAMFLSAFLNYAFRAYASHSPNQDAAKQLEKLKETVAELEISLANEQPKP